MPAYSSDHLKSVLLEIDEEAELELGSQTEPLDAYENYREWNKL